MKSIIIYHSQCGHTKKYAEDLKTRILADEIISVKKLSFKKLKQYDTIFYGGNIKNNVIVGLNKLLKKYNKIKDKNIFVFGVGLSFQTNVDYTRNLIITANGLDDKHIRLYLLPGGFDIKLFSPFKRFLIKTGIKIFKSKNKDSNSTTALNMLIGNGINLVNINNLDKMVNVYNKIKENE